MSIYIQVEAQRYATQTGETLYEALARHGLAVRKACVNGACGVCRCRLVAGAVDYRGRQPYGLDETARSEGYILPCIAYAEGDVTLNELRIVR
ncbi:2Fe-2S iron-sulfur cluster-binding protein [Salinispirillum sp. LH 10-3-1]|uniref:2Fe-2S iron-sulfur cluster-binding protein n=1 Tax=Salinispirillum sp. LH 10-3-1 TaxID=2952525 RepID=A0AB38YIE9_9GAMM